MVTSRRGGDGEGGVEGCNCYLSLRWVVLLVALEPDNGSLPMKEKTKDQTSQSYWMTSRVIQGTGDDR